MRKHLLFMVILFLIGLVGTGLTQNQTKSVNVAGEWDITIEFYAVKGHHTVIFTQDGDSLTGIYRGKFKKGDLTHSWREIRYAETDKGTVKGDSIDFTGHLRHGPLGINYHYTGKVTGDAMKGTVDMGEYGVVPFSAKRKADGKSR